MTESFRDQIERLIQMSKDSGETWDLSPNDQAAITAVLERNAILHAALNGAVKVIRTWHGDVAWDLYYKNAPEMAAIREVLE